jgi:hypothetical protein
MKSIVLCRRTCIISPQNEVLFDTINIEVRKIEKTLFEWSKLFFIVKVNYDLCELYFTITRASEVLI